MTLTIHHRPITRPNRARSSDDHVEDLSGWGRTNPVRCQVLRPHDAFDIDAMRADRSTVIARGQGRSYGDAAQSVGGTVIETGDLDDLGAFDPDAGTITVGAGLTLDRLLQFIVPQGWFVAVTPGTRQVSIGGAIAADDHGKNHHHDGTFCQHVTDITIVTGRGVEHLTPAGTPAEFWATAGGMGLTGVITSATLQLRPIETPFIASRTERHRDLPSMMDALRTADATSTYTVAWIDTLNPGRRLGRGLVMTGEHATRRDVEARHPQAPRRRRAAASPDHRQGVQPGLVSHQHPGRTPRIHRSVLPPTRRRRQLEPALRQARVHPMADRRARPARRHDRTRAGTTGRHRGGIVPVDPQALRTGQRRAPVVPDRRLDPRRGHPTRLRGLAGTLQELDRRTADLGGRVYFAKDARLDPGLVPAMYPRLDQWRTVRDAMDPHDQFASDLSRRLRLTR